jgi:hypothetical protein
MWKNLVKIKIKMLRILAAAILQIFTITSLTGPGNSFPTQNNGFSVAKNLRKSSNLKFFEKWFSEQHTIFPKSSSLKSPFFETTSKHSHSRLTSPSGQFPITE